MDRIVVVGGGGHAHSVIDALVRSGRFEIAGIVDPDISAGYGRFKVIGSDGDLADIRRSGIECAAIGIGHMGQPVARRSIVKRVVAAGFALPPVVDPSAVLACDAAVADGAFVGKLAVVNSAATVGRCAIVNTGAIVEHDCLVGGFSHVAVNATLCGGATLGEDAFVGAGSTVIQNVAVGRAALVGAGATVIADVPEGAKVLGVYNGR